MTGEERRVKNVKSEAVVKMLEMLRDKQSRSKCREKENMEEQNDSFILPKLLQFGDNYGVEYRACHNEGLMVSSGGETRGLAPSTPGK